MATKAEPYRDAYAATTPTGPLSPDEGETIRAISPRFPAVLEITFVGPVASVEWEEGTRPLVIVRPHPTVGHVADAWFLDGTDLYHTNAPVDTPWRPFDADAWFLDGTDLYHTTAPVDTPWRPFDDDDDRRLIEHCGIKEAKQPWDWGHPPQKTARTVGVHVLCTWLLLALATAYRLRRAHEATGDEPVGWRRWRRQLLEQTRDQVIVFAQGDDGSLPLAESSLLLGVKLKEVPPGIGTRQDILARYRHPSGYPGQVSAPSTGLTVMLELQRTFS